MSCWCHRALSERAKRTYKGAHQRVAGAIVMSGVRGCGMGAKVDVRSSNGVELWRS